jgi:hypothetical protein
VGCTRSFAFYHLHHILPLSVHIVSYPAASGLVISLCFY